MNLYAYVGNDPMNFVDPFGLAKEPPIIVTAQRIDPCGNIRGCVSDLRSIVDLMREYTNQTTQGGAGEGAAEFTEIRELRQCERNIFGRDFAPEVLDEVQVYDLPVPLLGGNVGITLGTDVYIRPDINLGTVQGMGLLGHEVAHVNENFYGSMSGPGWAWEALTRGEDNLHEQFARDMQTQIMEGMTNRGETGCPSATPGTP